MNITCVIKHEIAMVRMTFFQSVSPMYLPTVLLKRILKMNGSVIHNFISVQLTHTLNIEQATHDRSSLLFQMYRVVIAFYFKMKVICVQSKDKK